MRSSRVPVRRLARTRAGFAAVPVVALTIQAEVKELLTLLLQAIASGECKEFPFGDATVETAYHAGPRRGRRGWVLSVSRIDSAQPYEIDVGSPLTRSDVGWIDQGEGHFLVVGSRVAIVWRLVTALGVERVVETVIKSV